MTSLWPLGQRNSFPSDQNQPQEKLETGFGNQEMKTKNISCGTKLLFGNVGKKGFHQPNG